MMLLVILLLFSVGLNIALLFGIVRRNADDDMRIIYMKEGIEMDDKIPIHKTQVSTN
jgi:hypothetical protein